MSFTIANIKEMTINLLKKKKEDIFLAHHLQGGMCMEHDDEIVEDERRRRKWENGHFHFPWSYLEWNGGYFVRCLPMNKR